MYLDKQTRFSDSQAITATAVGTNVIDLGVNRSIGNGEPMSVVWTVVVAAKTSVGDENYSFEVQYSDDSPQTAGRKLMGQRSFKSTAPQPDQDAALLVVGFKIVIPIPPTILAESGRFLGVRYVAEGTSPTITCTCDFIPSSFVDATVYYANNYDIV